MEKGIITNSTKERLENLEERKTIVSEKLLIENAKENAKLNHISNTDFYCMDASEIANNIEQHSLNPDVIVVDPPRKGLNDSVIESIVKMNPSRLIYVSCNPATLARDLHILLENGFCYSAGTAVDMFPRTNHVETVVLMSRKDT